MSTIYDVPASLRNLLDDHGVHYEVLCHMRDYSAQRTAADTFTPGREFAKCVALWIDNYYALAVLPADHLIDFELFRDALACKAVGLAREDEIHKLFPDCEIGAEHPFGNLYDMPVYCARQLAEDEKITFNAGTHEEAIRMSFPDFQRLCNPILMDFACKM